MLQVAPIAETIVLQERVQFNFAKIQLKVKNAKIVEPLVHLARIEARVALDDQSHAYYYFVSSVVVGSAQDG